MISSRSLGERIVAARKAKGFTQAKVAAAIGLGRSTLVATEKGERRPSNSELYELSRFLEVPLHNLLQDGPPSPDIAPRFRIAPSSGIDRGDLEEAVAILKALSQKFFQLETLLGVTRSSAPLEYVTMYQATGQGDGLDPQLAGENAAMAVRKMVGLGDGPALALDEIFEIEAGLRIFYLNELPSTVAGIFVWGQLLGGCIGINRKHPHERRRWTLVHEIGHFLRDRDAGDVLPAHGQRRRDPSEIFADAFTKNFLLPHSGVSKQFGDRCRANRGRFSVADILWLADLHQIAFQPMTFRLEDLGLLSRGTFERITAHRLKPDEGRRDLGILTTDQRCQPDRLPKRYVSLALDAYEKELITEGELGDYLEADRVSARRIYQQNRRRDLGDGFEVDLDLAQSVAVAS